MDEPTRQRLLQLNRDFYTTVAAPFDERTGMRRPASCVCSTVLSAVQSGSPLQVADIGCGNGRFALLLESLGIDVRYTGVDGNEQLLERAVEQTASLRPMLRVALSRRT